MAQLQQRVEIARPLEEVFALVAKPRHRRLVELGPGGGWAGQARPVGGPGSVTSPALLVGGLSWCVR
jgi:hypothetical protein